MNWPQKSLLLLAHVFPLSLIWNPKLKNQDGCHFTKISTKHGWSDWMQFTSMEAAELYIDCVCLWRL